MSDNAPPFVDRPDALRDRLHEPMEHAHLCYRCTLRLSVGNPLPVLLSRSKRRWLLGLDDEAMVFHNRSGRARRLSYSSYVELLLRSAAL